MSADPLLTRASLLINSRRYSEALELLATKPDDRAARILASSALLKSGNQAGALREADFAVRLAHDDPRSHAMRGDVLLAMHRWSQAQSAGREAVRLAPDDPNGHRIVAWAVLKSARVPRFQPGRVRMAEDSVAALSRLAPASVETHNLRGAVALARTQNRQAEDAFREALKLDPLNPVLLRNLAIALERQGRHRDAISLYESAVSADPSLQPSLDAVHKASNNYIRGASGPRDALIWLVLSPIPLVAILSSGWVFAHFGVRGAIVAAAAGGADFVALLVWAEVTSRRRRGHLRAGTRLYTEQRLRSQIRSQSKGVILLLAGFAPAAGLAFAPRGFRDAAALIALVYCVAWLVAFVLLWERAIRPRLYR